MSQFFRLSTSELVVDVRDHLSVGNRYLNEVAGKAVARRLRPLHPDQSDPPRFPENFEIEALSNFDPKSVWPQYGPFEFTNGIRVWITRPIPSLIISGY